MITLDENEQYKELSQQLMDDESTADSQNDTTIQKLKYPYSRTTIIVVEIFLFVIINFSVFLVLFGQRPIYSCPTTDATCPLTLIPTSAPSVRYPTNYPSPKPTTFIPTVCPFYTTRFPTSPTMIPTTNAPTRTFIPSGLPTIRPTFTPSSPTIIPTSSPSSCPTRLPTPMPSQRPTSNPTEIFYQHLYFDCGSDSSQIACSSTTSLCSQCAEELIPCSGYPYRTKYSCINYSVAPFDLTAMVCGSLILGIVMAVSAAWYYAKASYEKYKRATVEESTSVHGLKLDYDICVLFYYLNIFNVFRIKASIEEISETDFKLMLKQSILNHVELELQDNSESNDDVNLFKCRRFNINNLFTRTLLFDVNEVVELLKVKIPQREQLRYFAIHDIGYHINPLNFVGTITMTVIISAFGYYFEVIIAVMAKVIFDLLMLLMVERMYLFETRLSKSCSKFDKEYIYIDKNLLSAKFLGSIYFTDRW